MYLRFTRRNKDGKQHRYWSVVESRRTLRIASKGFRAFSRRIQRACRIGARRPDLADATLRSYASKLNTRLHDLLRRVPTHALGDKLQRALTDRAVPPSSAAL